MFAEFAKAMDIETPSYLKSFVENALPVFAHNSKADGAMLEAYVEMLAAYKVDQFLGIDGPEVENLFGTGVDVILELEQELEQLGLLRERVEMYDYNVERAAQRTALEIILELRGLGVAA